MSLPMSATEQLDELLSLERQQRVLERHLLESHDLADVQASVLHAIDSELSNGAKIIENGYIFVEL